MLGAGPRVLEGLWGYAANSPSPSPGAEGPMVAAANSRRQGRAPCTIRVSVRVQAGVLTNSVTLTLTISLRPPKKAHGQGGIAASVMGYSCIRHGLGAAKRSVCRTNIIHTQLLLWTACRLCFDYEFLHVTVQRHTLLDTQLSPC